MTPIELLKQKVSQLESMVVDLKEDILKLEEPEVVEIEVAPKKEQILILDEKTRILTALKWSSTNKGAAQLLDISERTLYRKRKEYNI